MPEKDKRASDESSSEEESKSVSQSSAASGSEETSSSSEKDVKQKEATKDDKEKGVIAVKPGSDDDEEASPIPLKRQTEVVGSKRFRGYSFSQEPVKGDEAAKKDKKKEKPKRASLKELFSFADGLDKFMMIIGTLCAMAYGTVLPLFSLIFGGLIDAFNKSTDEVYDQIKGLCLYLVYIAIAAFILAFCQNAFWMLAGERQARRIREAYLKAILRQDVAWFDVQGTGALTTRISGDTVTMQNGMSEKVAQTVQFYSTFIAGFALGFTKGWKLTLVLLAVTPVLAICGGFMMKLMANMTTKGQAAYASAGKVAQEVLSNARTVASFSGEEREAQRYTLNLDAARKIGARKGFIAGLGLGTTMLIMFCTYALAFWYGSVLVLAKEYTGGNVMSVFFSVLIGGFSLGQAAPGLEALSTAQGAAYEFHQTLKRKPAIDATSQDGEKPETPTKGDITLKNVSFKYPTRPEAVVLDNFNMTIKAGQTVALVGASGSGKSSVIQLVQRFYDVDSGEITLDGKNIKDLNVKWLRQQYGFVGQEPVLFAGSIAENIAFGKPGASQDEVEEAAKMANAHKFIVKFPQGYGTEVGEKGAKLSGGQKQRIAIARAILKNPSVLLLDEATSALDTESEKVVQDALEKVMKGRTTIVVAHRLATIRDADLIMVLSNGKVVETGTDDELMQKKGHYFELVKLQGMGRRGTVAQHVQEGSKKDDDEVVHNDKKEDAEKKKLKPVSLGRLFALNKPEIPWIVLGTLAGIANGVANPVFAIIFSKVLDLYYKPEDQLKADVAMWCGLFIAIGGVMFICMTLQMGLFGYAGEWLTQRVRQIAFRSMLRKDIGWFDAPDHASSILTARLAQDATYIEGLVGSRIGLTVQNFATLAAGLIIAFYYGWKLTLVVLASAPLVSFGGIMEMAAAKGLGTKSQAATAEANQIASEAISAIRTVAAFTTEDRVQASYERKLRAPFEASIKKNWISGIGMGAGQFFIFTSYALSMWFGGYLISKGEMQFVDVMQVFFAIIMCAMSLGQSGAMAPNATKAKTAAEEVFNMVDHVPAIDSASEKGEKPESCKGHIELKGVEFRYPTRPEVTVLKNMNLSCEPGKVLALVGQSGSGKSSIVSLLERFYDPEQGAVLLDGTPITDLNIKWLRAQIGLVSQEPVLFSGTIADNIRYGKPDATMEEVVKAAKASNAHKFVKKFPDGYDTEVGERGAQLSGGQKQRIAIARAIIKNPKVLLLDEATSALDSESEKVVQEALNNVMKGRTTVVIAHRLSTIRHADTIAVISNGVVAETGTHEELIKREGLYHNLVMRQT